MPVWASLKCHWSCTRVVSGACSPQRSTRPASLNKYRRLISQPASQPAVLSAEASSAAGREIPPMNKFNKPSGRTAKKVKRDNTKKSKKAAGVPQVCCCTPRRPTAAPGRVPAAAAARRRLLGCRTASARLLRQSSNWFIMHASLLEDCRLHAALRVSHSARTARPPPLTAAASVTGPQ